MIDNRHVFYISGFDPRGPLFTYQNCVEQTRKWSALTGHGLHVGERMGDSVVADVWTIDSDFGARRVRTTFHCLRWDDIVRRNWDKSERRVAFKVLGMVPRIVRSGAFDRAWRESWPFAVTMATAALPAALIVACILLVMLGLALMLLASSWAFTAIGVVLLIGAAWLGHWGKCNVPRFNPDWTGRTGLFAWRLATDPPVKGFDERLDAMAAYVLQTIDRERPSEVQVIGHSLGTILAPLVTVRLLNMRSELGSAGSGLTLVTLGQLSTFLRDVPQAKWYRNALSIFERFPNFSWLDFSSPPDGACYALVNTLDFLPHPPVGLPRLMNAQFHKSFSQDSMASARLRRIEMHFLYLKSPDYPQLETDCYDYVALIAGPISAAERFKTRQSGMPFYRKQVT